jgi:hypothetical protein
MVETDRLLLVDSTKFQLHLLLVGRKLFFVT